MSYDLVVWEGEQPASDSAARDVFDELMQQYQDSPEPVSPTPLIRSYVARLLARWPDLTECNEASVPWADGPLINNAAGPVIYFSLVADMADEASAFCAREAIACGLVCFDPQLEELRH